MKIESILCPYCSRQTQVNVPNKHTVSSIGRDFSDFPKLGFQNQGDYGKGILNCTKCGKAIWYKTSKE